MGSETLRFIVKATDQASSTLRGVGGGFGRMGAAAKAGIAMALAALAALGAALVKFATDLDNAYDAIRIGTGATGADLTGLQEDFKAVVKDVPTDFVSASTAIADLSTRLGLTGKPLRILAGDFLKLHKILGVNVKTSIAETTRLFGDWSIKTIPKQREAMNLLFRTTQQTGIGWDTLTQTVVQFGAPLRNLGFTFGESIAMLGKWEKEGVNVSTVLTGMRFALKTFGAAGIDPRKGLATTIEQIKTLPKLKALDLGKNVFGLRAFSDVVAAIREGRFQYQGLIKSVASGTDTIAKAERDTRDWQESLVLLKNRALVALEPVLIKMTNGLTTLIDTFAKLPVGVQATIAGLAALIVVGAGAALTIGPLVGLGGSLVAAYGLLAGAAGAAAAAQVTLTAAQVSGSLATGALLGKTTALTMALPLMSVAGVAGLGAIAIAAGALLWKLKDIYDETMSIYDDVDKLSDQVTAQINRLADMQRARPEGVSNIQTRKIQDQIMKVTVQTNGEGDLTKLESKMALFKRFAKFNSPGFSSLTLDIKAGKLKGADLVYTFDKLRTDIMRQLHMTEKQADTILRGIFGKKYKPLKVPKVNMNAWKRLPTELEKNTALVVKVAKRDGAKAGSDLIAAFVRNNKPAPYSVSAAKAAQAIRNKLNTLPGYGSALGANLANSVAAGISSATSTVALRAEQMVRIAMERARAAADSHSPSRKMIAFGRDDMAGGFAIGLTAGTPRVSAAASEMALAAMRAPQASQAGFAGSGAVTSQAGGVAPAIHVHVHVPGGTTLIGTAREVGEVIAPYVKRALDRSGARAGRGR